MVPTCAENHASLVIQHEGWGLIHHGSCHQVHGQDRHDLVCKQKAAAYALHKV